MVDKLRALARENAKARMGRLTTQEMQAAMLTCEGMPLKEVAATLIRAFKTVDGQMSSVYKKTGVRNRVELTRLAVCAGMVPVEYGGGE